MFIGRSSDKRGAATQPLLLSLTPVLETGEGQESRRGMEEGRKAGGEKCKRAGGQVGRTTRWKVTLEFVSVV